VTTLYSIKGKYAVRAFANAGGMVHPGKCDHVNIRMPGGQLITIPVSREVKIDIQKNHE